MRRITAPHLPTGSFQRKIIDVCRLRWSEASIGIITGRHAKIVVRSCDLHERRCSLKIRRLLPGGPCGKLLIKPSKTAVTRIKRRLAEEMRSLRGAAPGVIIGRLNPIITGWAAYYRGVVSTQTFHTLDHHLWRLTYRWALRRHPNKPRTWVRARYFGLFHPSRQDRWIFGDRTSGAYPRRFSWTKIVRHQMVTGTPLTR